MKKTKEPKHLTFYLYEEAGAPLSVITLSKSNGADVPVQKEIHQSMRRWEAALFTDDDATL